MYNNCQSVDITMPSYVTPWPAKQGRSCLQFWIPELPLAPEYTHFVLLRFVATVWEVGRCGQKTPKWRVNGASTRRMPGNSCWVGHQEFSVCMSQVMWKELKHYQNCIYWSFLITLLMEWKCPILCNLITYHITKSHLHHVMLCHVMVVMTHIGVMEGFSGCFYLISRLQGEL